jgi:hypothetical protein
LAARHKRKNVSAIKSYQSLTQNEYVKKPKVSLRISILEKSQVLHKHEKKAAKNIKNNLAATKKK